MTGEQKVIAAGAVLTIVFIAGVVLLLGRQGVGQEFEVRQVVGDASLVTGRSDAKVALVEFADFQCPACGAAYPTVKRILADYSDRIAFYYRHFPIVPPHSNAYAAAYAAEAARVQGKFLGAYNWLFENQSTWEEAKVDADYFYRQFGQVLDLSKEKFLQDYQSDEVKKVVSQDFSAGRRLGVNSTPTFFINGKKLVGVQGYESFKREIDQALANGPQK